jgi:hypothetical protein
MWPMSVMLASEAPPMMRSPLGRDRPRPGFLERVAVPPGTHPGIIIARLPDTASPADMAARIVEAIATVGAGLQGAITIVEAARVRVFGGGDPNGT